MRIDVFTIFPTLIDNYAGESLLGKAQNKGLLKVNAHDLRDSESGTHKGVDDAPFGGGPGMVLKPEPVFKAVEDKNPPRPLFLLSPTGQKFNHSKALQLSETGGFSLLCGRYEGVDQRISDHLVDGEISLGDFVLSGGEVAALAIIESVARLVPGVMGNSESSEAESFTSGLLEYPQYTRPANFRGMRVPDILLSGNHKEIDLWRKKKMRQRTTERRPDFLN